ncbi:MULTISPECIES: hypothetical protein [unclassified Ruegeria]|uniref:hypothetical protein n=1 Tax=unclassified Ruegeria TaxID=2625375 RepID=UPI001488A641|nr:MULTISPECIES: hypothetical protein [unclassified Ruegeria]NOD65501.1 hypothetical protein [Ruegeria sp. HKCCD6109]
MKLSCLILAASFSSLFAVSAHAVSINVIDYVPTSYNTIFGSGHGVSEDFESLGAALGQGEVANGFSTTVGTFSTLGGTGSGGTVSGLSGNTGTQLALRSGSVFGRQNLSPSGGSWFLDSNDTSGIQWDVALAGGKAFDKLAFALTDASDAGGFLRISAGGSDFELRTGGKLADGNIKLVTIDFGGPTNSASISLANYSTQGGANAFLNDGFSIDGMQVAAVPIPPSILMLGAGLLGLGLVANRRRRTST